MNSFKVSAEESIKNIRLNRKNRDIATRKWGFAKQINEIYFKFPWITRIWKKWFLRGGISESGWSVGSQIKPGLLWVKYEN